MHRQGVLSAVPVALSNKQYQIAIKSISQYLREIANADIQDPQIQQMLEEAVAQAKSGLSEDEPSESWSPQINVGASVMIPERYVKDLNLRMSLYRRIAELNDKRDVDAFGAELIDRFGTLPEEVEHLLKIIKITMSITI